MCKLTLKQNMALVLSILAPLWFTTPASALTIKGNFTPGICPVQTPPDGAACPGGASTCPAFHNPSLIPAGFNSVSYCNFIGTNVIGSGPNFYTRAFTQAEQAAFNTAAQNIQSFIKDNITVTIEAYANGALSGPSLPPGVVFVGIEFFTPVCMSDKSLPPYSNGTPNIVCSGGDSHTGTCSYANLPQSFDTFVKALQAKNAKNTTPFPFTDNLPKANKAVMEWSSTFLGQINDSMILAWFLPNFFLPADNSNYNTGTQAPGTAPFTVCGSPANMKALGLDKGFNNANFKFDDINSPQYNIYATLPGDGVYIAGDFPNANVRPHGLPYTQRPSGSPYFPWITDNNAIAASQLPKSFFEHHNLQAVYYDDCDVGPNGQYLSEQDSPTIPGQKLPWCSYPKGFNWGINLIATTQHELGHLLGIMWSEYYKQAFEGNAMGYAYGNANFVMDLFILDSDSVANINPKKLSTYASIPRNMESNTPQQHGTLSSINVLEAWIQLGSHDHVFTYLDGNGAIQSVPLQNYSVGNPDGDIARTTFRLIPPCTNNVNCTPNNGNQSAIFNDPQLLNLPGENVIHPELMSVIPRGASSFPATESVLNMYSALGYDVDFSVLANNIEQKAPTADWYQICFDQGSGGTGNGSTTGQTGGVPPVFDRFRVEKAGCKFSVEPAYLATCNLSLNKCGP